MKILEFSAPSWCFPCRQLAPQLASECSRLNVELEVYDLDTDDGYQKSIERGVKSVPTIIAVDDSGVEIGRDFGSLAWKSVEYWLTQESLKKDESRR